jgi:PII-like signaling protein
MVISVGAAGPIGRALEAVTTMLDCPLVTLERVRVCKRDGERLATPVLPDDASPDTWQKITVFASEQATHAGRPLYVELVRALREAGALGATALRGVWGYHGDHPPRGDRMWSIRRDVPVVTVLVDAPERMARWYDIVDELTAETGLVTSELVPVARGHQIEEPRRSGALP